MEIRNIISFMKIAETNSFSKAATALGYTQSNVTMQIKQLESELGTILFDRIGKQTTLTENGRVFAKYAMEILTSVDNAKLALTNSLVPCGEIKIGILESLCITYMPEIINRFHLAYPAVNTIIKIGTFEELSFLLNTNQIDLLWTFDDPITNENWIKEFEYPNQICILAAPSNNILLEKEVSLASFTDETFIFTENDCSYRNAFQQLLTSSKIPYNTFMEIGNTEIIKKFVASGLCLSVLPEFTIQSELSLGTIQVVRLPEFQLVMYGQVFYHKNKWISTAMKAFLAELPLHLNKPCI